MVIAAQILASVHEGFRRSIRAQPGFRLSALGLLAMLRFQMILVGWFMFLSIVMAHGISQSPKSFAMLDTRSI